MKEMQYCDKRNLKKCLMLDLGPVEAGATCQNASEARKIVLWIAIFGLLFSS